VWSGIDGRLVAAVEEVEFKLGEFKLG